MPSEKKFIATHSIAARMPDELRKELLADDFMQQCCLCGSEQKQWHHNFEYARKALNEAWCILPLCPTHHDMVRIVGVRRLLDWAMLNRAKKSDLKKYSRVMDYVGRKAYLNRLFGEFSPRKLQDYFYDKVHEEKLYNAQSNL